MNNTKRKPIVTLVGLKQAKKGFSFLNDKPPEECENCALFKICLAKLEMGRAYVVTEVRDKIFPCKVHEEGIRVVEVIEPYIEANIDNKLAFPCGIITFQPQTCEEPLCPNYAKCAPRGLRSGDKCRVVEVRKKVECPMGRHLVLSVLQRMAD